MERAERSAHQEADLQRWADDGGAPRTGRPGQARTIERPRSPWVTVGWAVAVGFTLGWLSGRRA
ncbi:MAG TPA: hypothetical protein VD866_27525 [Urbifossiella sp.]|nr:hypothetical protein [Urbifossiella sp.]